MQINSFNIPLQNNDKRNYDKESHLKLKLKLLWVDLKNEL